jgi:hypothetical protein
VESTGTWAMVDAYADPAPAMTVPMTITDTHVLAATRGAALSWFMSGSLIPVPEARDRA